MFEGWYKKSRRNTRVLFENGTNNNHQPTLLEIQREEEAMQKQLKDAREKVMVNSTSSVSSRSNTNQSNVWRSPMKKGSDEALLAGGLHGLMQKQSIEREENNAIALAIKAVEKQELKDKQIIKGKKR